MLALLCLVGIESYASGTAEPSGPNGQTPATFLLTSPAFVEGGYIPALYTCDGQDHSPALRWFDPPVGTQSFALIADDPDLQGGTFTHWVLYNIPVSTDGLPEGLPPGQVGASGGNDFGRTGYSGPCSPSEAHRYYFTLYALDLPPSVTFTDKISARGGVRRAIQGHVLGRAQLMGRYGRGE